MAAERHIGVPEQFAFPPPLLTPLTPPRIRPRPVRKRWLKGENVDVEAVHCWQLLEAGTHQLI